MFVAIVYCASSLQVIFLIDFMRQELNRGVNWYRIAITARLVAFLVAASATCLPFIGRHSKNVITTISAVLQNRPAVRMQNNAMLLFSIDLVSHTLAAARGRWVSYLGHLQVS